MLFRSGWGEKGRDKLVMRAAGLGEGSLPTHRRAQGRGLGTGSTARSLYLLENEGFHSSDEGHERMKHKHSRNSKPQGENPDTTHSQRLAGGSLAPGFQLPLPSASEAARLACPLE